MKLDNLSRGSSGSSESAEAQTFGEGCAQVPTDGAGSFDGMVKDPVGTPASNNPLLTTLVEATVSDGTVTANVICGNVPTANATVYVIDKVLTGVK